MAEYHAPGGPLRIGAWTLLCCLGCTPDPPAPAPLVLLISMDTTRADDLSCYGGANADTPTLDALAARGVRFQTALSPAPTTLSAHASLFTGLDAHGTAILSNGDALRADLPALAERFAAAGWDTIGVVAASALDRDRGLNRGFRLYDDAMGEAVRKRYESSAPEVTARALAAVDQRSPGRPVFLFVHYYDAHMPWTSAPASFQARFLNPDYTGPLRPSSAAVARVIRGARAHGISEEDRDQALRYHRAEVAWTDHGLGALMEGLEARGLLADSLVIATADHGESLGEPGALEVLGHGIDVDPATLHVPLIVAGRGSFQTPVTVVDRQVRLLDIGTTALRAAGLSEPLGQGEDLGPLWRGEQRQAPLSFAEATKAGPLAESAAWNNLPMERAVADGSHLLVRTPWHKDERRLYAVAPGWPQREDAEVQRILEADLQAWDEAAPARRVLTVDKETSEMLRALGYSEESP